MKRFWKPLGVVAATIIACFIAVILWLYFYTADLPPISKLHELSPSGQSEVRIQDCDGSEVVLNAIPYERLGGNLLAAVKVVEGEPDPRSTYHAVLADFPHQRLTGRYSLQIARTMVCSESPPVQHVVRELRLANAIDRQFKRAQILTIYLNSVYLGAGKYGVEDAANHYFAKHPSDLSVPEGALLAALIASPDHFSPVTHPEGALQRRNVVIDDMMARGILSPESAKKAKATGLSLRPGLN